MSRVTTTNETTPQNKNKAPRKRVARPRTETSVAVGTSRPRRTASRATRSTADEQSVRGATSARARRAPTTIRTDTTNFLTKKKPSLFFVGLVFVGLVIVGVGVGIGMSDAGQIDVVAVVNERNERIERGEVRVGETATSSVANPVTTSGRLRPASSNTASAPTPVATPAVEMVATTTATDTATTEPETAVLPDDAVTPRSDASAMVSE